MRRDLSIIVILALLFGLSLGVSGWALNERFTETNERRQSQQSINERDRQQDLEWCREIEKLKKGRRDAAIQSRKDFEPSLKLLGIPVTPELIAAANEAKFTTLRRYKPEPCPRPTRRQ